MLPFCTLNIRFALLFLKIFSYYPLDLIPLDFSKMQNKNPGDIISGALDVRDRIRTHDLLVRSQTLYPAELHVHFIYRFSPATVCIVTAAGENVNRIFQFFQTILSAACFSVACTTFTSYFSRMACLNSS